jgi:hypothetical protein
MTEKETTVRTSERVVPIEFSDTGDFKITKEELRAIIRRQLSAKQGKPQKQRALFGSVLNSMKLHPRGDAREPMLKIFVEILREMKEAGQVEFQSGRTAILVRLV